MVQENRYQHYSRQLDRLSVMDDIITRQHFDKRGSVEFFQTLLPKYLVTDLLESLNGQASNNPGLSKMLQDIRRKYYDPPWQNMS